jgi:hypothetical protein
LLVVCGDNLIRHKFEDGILQERSLLSYFAI